MKKKKSIILKLSDILVLLFCLGGSATSLWLFWNDLNATLSKLNEKPVASITYKYKVSQRKFVDRLVWDRLQQNSPLYNGDTIRTTDQAQASIFFLDKTVLELGANSIIQIFVDDRGTAAVDFAGGDLYVDSAASTGNMVLRSGNAAVTLEPGAALTASSAAKTDGEAPSLNLQLVSGTATYTGTTGSTQVLREGTGLAVDAGGAARQQLLTMVSPVPNARFLKQEDALLSVPFNWETQNLPQGSFVILETSVDKNFTALEEQIAFSRITTVTLNLSGSRYWRLYVRTADGQTDSGTIISGRIQVLDAPPPSLVVPSVNASFKYRTRLPSVRFVWNGNEYGTSYIFEVADNQRMENPTIRQQTTQNSSIVSSLKAGRWYWRVTPIYAVAAGKEGIPSRTAFFDILQSGELTALSLTAPASNSFVNTAQSGGVQNQQTVFSWKHDAEAVLYTVKIAQNEALTGALIERQTADNWLALIPQTDGITNGRWFWSVTSTDSEGNVSPLAPVRSFTAIDGEMVFHTMFPPEGYRVADSRVPDMRFTWKKNFSDQVRFQVASDRNFNNLVYNELLSSSVLSTDGKNLRTGAWYWRLVSVSPDGTNQFETEAKSFTVIPPLDNPTIQRPAPAELLAAKPDQTVQFLWDAVTGADYYQFKLFRQNSQTPLNQQNVYGQTQTDIPASILTSGSYRITVQAFADETLNTSRRTGLLSEVYFSFKKIFPVKLAEPAQSAIFDGMAAVLTPSDVTWTSAEPLAESEFVLSKNSEDLPATHDEAGGNTILMRQKSVFGTVRLPVLEPGDYWWTVTAKTTDGFDVSAAEKRNFTILPIPLLATPAGLLPQNETVFDAAYLSESLQVVLSWQPVAGADSFEFVLYKTNGAGDIQEGRVLKTAIVPAEKNAYTIDDLGELDEGNFVWTVEARRHTSDGAILQHGEPVQATFAIELPPVPAITLPKTGELYGN